MLWERVALRPRRLISLKKRVRRADRRWAGVRQGRTRRTAKINYTSARLQTSQPERLALPSGLNALHSSDGLIRKRHGAPPAEERSCRVE